MWILVVSTRTHQGTVTLTSIPGFENEASAKQAGARMQDEFTTKDTAVWYAVLSTAAV